MSRTVTAAIRRRSVCDVSESRTECENRGVVDILRLPPARGKDPTVHRSERIGSNLFVPRIVHGSSSTMWTDDAAGPVCVNMPRRIFRDRRDWHEPDLIPPATTIPADQTSKCHAQNRRSCDMSSPRRIVTWRVPLRRSRPVAGSIDGPGDRRRDGRPDPARERHDSGWRGAGRNDDGFDRTLSRCGCSR